MNIPENRMDISMHQERIGRIAGLVTFSFFTLRQLLPRSLGGQFPGFEDGLIFTRWLLITGLFALFLHAYIIRKPALALANRPLEILLPLICAPLPLIVIIFCQYYYGNAAFRGFFLTHLPWLGEWFTIWGQSKQQLTIGLLIMALGEAITLSGMLWLRGSFSIFTESRALVTTGPYRWLRHPLYSGEILSIWGYVVVVGNGFTSGGAALFTILQIMRARLEEKKLAASHPDYGSYRRQTGFLLPRPRRRQPGPERE